MIRDTPVDQHRTKQNMAEREQWIGDHSRPTGKGRRMELRVYVYETGGMIYDPGVDPGPFHTLRCGSDQQLVDSFESIVQTARAKLVSA
jgi:hypothetical protein